MPARTYEDGVRDGKIATLEHTAAKHTERLASHSGRLRALERVAWIMVGAVGAFNALPALIAMVQTLSGQL